MAVGLVLSLPSGKFAPKIREAALSKSPKMKRRQFLAGAVAAGPALGLAATAGKAAAQTPAPRGASVPPVPPNENVLPDATPLTEARSGSDFIVDVSDTLKI